MKRQLPMGLQRIVVGAVFIGVLAASGCGQKFGDVGGKVTYHGKPLRWGTVKAQWTGGPPGTPNAASAKLGDDGSFDIGKVPAGATVQIFLHIDPITIGGSMSGNKPSPEVIKQTQEKVGYEEIPDKYKKAETSGLSVSPVKPGRNELNIDVQG
jgi:hypothetical protein